MTGKDSVKAAWRIGSWFIFVLYIAFTVSVLFFLLFEICPSMLDYVNLRSIRYYALKTEYRPDPVLAIAYRNRKHLSRSFYGDLYSGGEGIPVHAIRSEISYNELGFRVNSSPLPFDAVVIGDSFVEFSENDLDTFSERLKAETGLSTFNLGRAWYGPNQYLELFKRHAVPMRPRYAILCFFAGNDIGDIQQYRLWLRTGKYYFYTDYSEVSLPRRYLAAVSDTASAILKVIQLCWAELQPPKPPPNAAVIRLGQEDLLLKTDYWSEPEPPRQLLAGEPWMELRTLLDEFYWLSVRNGITPVVVFIPTKIQVYGRLYAGNGGTVFRARIKDQLLSEANVEQAMVILAGQLGLTLIDLVPGFQSAASQGKVLYYPLDTHWNREGRYLAAKLVAASLPGRPTRSPLLPSNQTRTE